MHLTVDPWWGNLELLAFGTTNDGLPRERYAAIDDEARSAFVLDEDGEVVVGFVVRDYDEGEPLDLDAPAFWSGPCSTRPSTSTRTRSRTPASAP